MKHFKISIKDYRKAKKAKEKEMRANEEITPLDNSIDEFSNIVETLDDIQPEIEEAMESLDNSELPKEILSKVKNFKSLYMKAGNVLDTIVEDLIDQAVPSEIDEKVEDQEISIEE